MHDQRILAQVLAGNCWCAICGAKDFVAGKTPGVCAEHETSEEERCLLPKILKLINVVRNWAREMQTTEEQESPTLQLRSLDNWPLLPVPKKRSPIVAQKVMFAKCLLRKQRCAESVVYLELYVEEELVNDPHCPVVEIEEVDYTTHEWHQFRWGKAPPAPSEKKSHWEKRDVRRFDHSMYRLRTDKGELYAFDPTGIQFGPECPTFMKWADYERIYISMYGPVLIEPLGSKRTSW